MNFNSKKILFAFVFIAYTLVAWAQEKSNTHKTFANSSPTLNRNEEEINDPIIRKLFVKDSPLGLFEPEQEDVSKRTLTGKHFKNPDGTMTAIIGAGPVHYQENGQWKTIATDIVPSNDSDYPYYNKWNEFKTYYGKPGLGNRIVLTNQRELNFWLNPQLVFLDKNYNTIHKNEIQQPRNTKANNDYLYYEKVFGTDIDAQFQHLTIGTELSYIINSPNVFSNAPTNANYFGFSETIELPNGWSAVVENNPDHNNDTYIAIKDHKGETLSRIETPLVKEKEGIANKTNESENKSVYSPRRIMGTFKVKSLGNNKFEVVYVADLGWFTYSGRNFPIEFDPIINVNTTNSSRYTGYIDDYGTITCSSGTMYQGYYDCTLCSNDYYQTWSKFDTYVGGASCVVATSFYIYQTAKTNPASCGANNKFRVGKANVEPVAASCSSINTAINALTTEYSRWDVYGTGCGTGCQDYDENQNNWKFFPMGSGGNSDVAAIINTTGSYLTVALDNLQAYDQHCDGGGNDDDYLTFASYSTINRPYLAISYHPPITGTISSTNPTVCGGGGNGTITVTPTGLGDCRLLATGFDNNTQPSGGVSYGNASLSANECLLTTNANSQNGSWLYTPSYTPDNFQVSYMQYIGSGGGADGMLFTYGAHGAGITMANNNPLNTATGLSIAFDTYTNTSAQSLAYLHYNGTQIAATATVNSPNFRTATFVPVTITVVNNLVTVVWNGTTIFNNVSLASTGYPSANKSTWKFGFLGTTGGVNDIHKIDNLNIDSQDLEYSVDGTTWQTSTTFSRTAGTYTVQARAKCATSCSPVTLGTVTLTDPFVPTANVTPTSATICSGGIQTLTASSNAPTTSTLGAGASTTTGGTTAASLGPNPMQTYYGGARQQMLVTAAELTALGISAGATLNSIGIDLATAQGTYTLSSFKVKIQHTSLTALTSTFVNTGFTTVYGASSYVPVVGINTLNFASNFTWDGTSNLLIEMTYSNSNGGNSGGTHTTARFDATTPITTAFYRVDNATAATVEAATTATYTYTSRNKLVWGFIPTYTWTPITGLYTNAGATIAYTSGTNATTVYASPTGTTTYTVVATASNGCTGSATSSITVVADPSAAVTGGASACGANVSGTLTATITGGTGTPTYQWQQWNDNAASWSNVGTNSSTYAATATNPTMYRVIATASGTGCDAATSAPVTLYPYPVPTAGLTSSAGNQLCAGTSTTLTGSGGSHYQFYVNGSSVQGPNTTSTYTFTPTNGQTASVTASTPITFDGNITSAEWGTSIASQTGGPLNSTGFGASHEINALYVRGDATNIYLGIAGNVQNGNRILLFIDSKSGGYSNGSFNRTNAPAGISAFNSGTTFDAGFLPDYCLVIGNSNAGYFWNDLFTLAATGSNTYLGNSGTAGLGANPANSDNSRGFEITIPKTSLGYASGDVKLMAMYISDVGFLNNKFLTHAGSGEGNYGSGAITFGAAIPDYVVVPAASLNIGTCTANSSTITYTVAAQPTYTTPSLTNSSICVGGSTAISTTVSGGTGTFNHQWQYSANGSTGWANVVNGTPANFTYTNATTLTLNIATTNAATPATGYYRCVLTSNTPSTAGCTATSANAVLTVVADPISPTSATKSPNTTSVCEGATLTISAPTGGSAGVGCTLEYRFTQNGGTSFSTPSTSIPVLTADLGGYDAIEVRYNNCLAGCETSNWTELARWTVIADPAISGTTQPASPICPGASGSFTVTATGGTDGTGATTQTYQWQYSANGSTGWANVANGTPAGMNYTGGTSASLTASTTNAVTPAGTYYYQCIVSASGSNCATVTTTVLSMTVNAEAAAPTATKSPNVTDVCVGATLTLTNPVLGSGGAGTQVFEYSTTGGTPWSSAVPSITAVAGSNSLWIRTNPSGSGCNVSPSTQYTWNGVANPSGGTISPVTFCSGTSATVSITGVSNASQYNWSLPSGLTGSSTTANISVSSSTPNTYTVTVTPQNVSGSATCNGTPINGTVTVNPNNTVGAASSSPTVCINTAITAITHATTGATGIGTPSGLPSGVSAAWGSNTITISGTPSASGIFNYSIPLTGGCGTVSATGTITVHAALVLTPGGTNVSCNGGTNGTASVSASGGTGTYTYSWYSGGSGNSITGLAAGTYTVLVTSGACSATTSYTVTQPASGISGSASAGSILCNGGTTTLTVTASGGTGALQYSLNGGAYQSGNTFTVNAGTHTVTVKDVNNCTKALTAVVVPQPTALVGNSCVVASDLCQAGTGAVKVVASGGTPPYTVSWTPSVGTPSPSNAIATSGGNMLIININGGTTISITITDANGCQKN